MSSDPETATDERPPRKGQIVKDGHLPVNEFLFDRAGAGSPYGEDMEFPLPVDTLPYRHPEA